MTPTMSSTIHEVTQRPDDALGVVRDRRLTLVEPRKESVQLGLRASGEDEAERRCDRNCSPSETAIVAHR